MRKCNALVFVLVFLTASFVYVTRPVVAVSEDSWISKASMNQARGGLGVAVLNGKVYAIGGSTQHGREGGYSSGVVGTNEEYDPETDAWRYKESMPTSRASFGIAVYQNKIYCIGGTSKDGVSAVNEVYDPATDTWEIKKSMPTPRYGVTANVVDGKIYLIGGLNITEVYDPVTDSWARKAPVPLETWLYGPWSCASAVVDGRIYVTGSGYLLGVGIAYHEIFDPKTNSWSSGAEWPTGGTFGVAGATVGIKAPKRIYVFGSDTIYWSLAAPNIKTLVYDPQTNTWTSGMSMPTPRINVGVAVLDDILYVIGGEVPLLGGGTAISAANEQYTPVGYGIVAPSPSPSPKSETEPSITTIAAVSVASAIVVSAGLIVYFKKHR